MGVRYLCPVCEHELKGLRKYCRHCRSFVDEPLVFKGLHLPNESDCYRSDVDYMDPRNMKKQQAHFYEHKQNMSDRPVYQAGHGKVSAHRKNGNTVRQSVEQGREWLQQQRAAASGKRKTTYSSQRSQAKKKEDSGVAWKVIVFIVLLILSNC